MLQRNVSEGSSGPRPSNGRGPGTWLLGLPLLVPVAWGAWASAEAVLGESEHKSLAKEVSAYFEARDNKQDPGKALGDLADAVQKIEKRKKVEIVTLVDDLAVILERSFEVEGNPTPGKALDQEFVGWGKKKVSYIVSAPKKYSRTKGTYSLMLVIPDAGEKPKEHYDQWWNGEIRDQTILAICQMPPDPERWGETGSSEDPGGRAVVFQVLGHLNREFRIDKGRVTLVGRGAGAAAALEIAAASPHTFCAVVTRSGDPRPTPVANFRNLPTLLAGGGANATTFEKEAKEAGITTVQLSPDATVDDIAAWVADKDRIDYPVHVSLSPFNILARSAYWLEVEGFDPDGNASIEAKIDREGNSIDIRAHGIASVQIDFNDAMLDLGKPVKVTCNGLQHEDVLGRKLQMALDTAYATGDPRRIVVARKKYDLPSDDETE